MHEMSLVRGIVKRVIELAETEGAVRVLRVVLKLGPLAHVEPGHLAEHFHEEARGTVVEGADIIIEQTDELHELSIESVDLLVDSEMLESD